MPSGTCSLDSTEQSKLSCCPRKLISTLSGSYQVLEEVGSHGNRGDAQHTFPWAACPSSSPGSFADSPSQSLSHLLFLLQIACTSSSGQQHGIPLAVSHCFPPAFLGPTCLVAVVVQRSLLAESNSLVWPLLVSHSTAQLCPCAKLKPFYVRRFCDCT